MHHAEPVDSLTLCVILKACSSLTLILGFSLQFKTFDITKHIWSALADMCDLIFDKFDSTHHLFAGIRVHIGWKKKHWCDLFSWFFCLLTHILLSVHAFASYFIEGPNFSLNMFQFSEVYLRLWLSNINSQFIMVMDTSLGCATLFIFIFLCRGYVDSCILILGHIFQCFRIPISSAVCCVVCHRDVCCSFWNKFADLLFSLSPCSPTPAHAFDYYGKLWFLLNSLFTLLWFLLLLIIIYYYNCLSEGCQSWCYF